MDENVKIAIAGMAAIAAIAGTVGGAIFLVIGNWALLSSLLGILAKVLAFAFLAFGVIGIFSGLGGGSNGSSDPTPSNTQFRPYVRQNKDLVRRQADWDRKFSGPQGKHQNQKTGGGPRPGF